MRKKAAAERVRHKTLVKKRQFVWVNVDMSLKLFMKVRSLLQGICSNEILSTRQPLGILVFCTGRFGVGSPLSKSIHPPLNPWEPTCPKDIPHPRAKAQKLGKYKQRREIKNGTSSMKSSNCFQKELVNHVTWYNYWTKTHVCKSVNKKSAPSKNKQTHSIQVWYISLYLP